MSMGVYIKGMEMPTSEEKCKFFQPAPFRAPFCVINGVCNGVDDCPLVPVPPHGDLIDRDALPYEECEYADGSPVFLIEKQEVDNAPIIIPAEEGEA